MDQIDGALLEHAGAHARLDMLRLRGSSTTQSTPSR